MTFFGHEAAMQQLGVPELVHMRQHCSTAAWRSGALESIKSVLWQFPVINGNVPKTVYIQF